MGYTLDYKEIKIRAILTVNLKIHYAIVLYFLCEKSHLLVIRRALS